jgi:hypothetical protein
MKATIQNILDQVTAARQTLIDLIRNLPDAAEGVQKLSKNCAIVNSSMLAKSRYSFYPPYYLTNTTKEEMIARIERGSAEDIKKLIEGILKSGTIKLGIGIHPLPPNFLDALKKAWV